MIDPPSINQKDLSKVLRVLKNMEPDSVKELKADMSSALGPFANKAAAQLPSLPPISGLARSPGYGRIKGVVSTTPGRSRKTGNKLVNIKVQSTTNLKTKGALFAEFAGTKSAGFTPAGKAMIRNLNEKQMIKRKSGRYTYQYVRENRKEIIKLAERILNKYMKKAERFL